jgi:hypothetical protein
MHKQSELFEPLLLLRELLFVPALQGAAAAFVHSLKVRGLGCRAIRKLP